MGKYTPGPWKFDWEDDNRTWAIVKSPTGKIIANVNTESGPDIAPLVSEKMPAQSNAQLIAAAPDLFAALKAILPMAENGAATPGHEGFCGPEQSCDCECMHAAYDSERLNQARAAIRKAEGE